MILKLKDYLNYKWDPNEFLISKWHKVTNDKGEIGPDVDRPIPRGRDFAIHKPQKINRFKFDLTNKKKDILCFCSFSLNTARIHRTKIYKEIKDKKFITFGKIFPKWTLEKSPSLNLDFLKKLKRSKFCISPQGNGVDCFRNWDALYEKCIPIVPPSKIMKRYSGLPIIFIDDYHSLSSDFLNKKYKEMLDVEYDFSKLKQSYWLSKYSKNKLESWGLSID